MSSSTGSDSTIPTTRVAIIGYGLAGAVFHAPLVASTPGMTVAAIVTNNPERHKQAQRDFPKATILSSVGQIWREPTLYDLVVVATPNRSHLPLGIAAMNAGLPVVIDKPISASVSNAEQLISTSERTGKLLTVFQNRRWDNDFLTVRRLLAAGTWPRAPARNCALSLALLLAAPSASLQRPERSRAPPRRRCRSR